MPAFNEIAVSQLARLLGLPDAPAIIDVRTEEDCAADPRLLPGSVRRDWRRAGEWARRIRRPPRRRPVPARPEAQPGRRRLAAARGGRGRNPGRRLRSLEGGRRAAAPDRALPPRDERGPHGLGHAQPPQGGPHRLSLADPPLRGPRSRVPVRRAVRGARGGGAVRRHALRHGGRVLEPPRRMLHLRRHARGIRAGNAEPLSRLAAIVRGADTARLGSRAAGGGAACRLARAFARCTGTTWRSSRRAWRSTTPSTAGAATRRPRRTTGPRPSPLVAVDAA